MDGWMDGWGCVWLVLVRAGCVFRRGILNVWVSVCVVVFLVRLCVRACVRVSVDRIFL